MKDDGEYDPSADIQGLVDASVTAVNAKNSELLGKLKTAQDKLAVIPEDFTAEGWLKMQNDLKDVDTSKLNTDEAVAAVKKQLEEAHAQELVSKSTLIGNLNSELETLLIDNAVSAAISAANGNSTLLLPHVKQQVSMVKGDDGKYAAVVLDANGTERFSMTNAGHRMGVDELVNEFKVNDTYKSAFVSGNTGGGAGGSGGKVGEANPFVKGKDYNLTEQSRLLNLQPEVAQQMQEAATAINRAATN